MSTQGLAHVGPVMVVGGYVDVRIGQRSLDVSLSAGGGLTRAVHCLARAQQRL